MVQKITRIMDVAKAAGVSTATVSRALSNPDLLTEATRETVFAAIRSTGYRVNRTARNLRTRQAGAVLVLVPNLGNPFFSQILAGISETLGERELSVLIADTSDPAISDKPLVDYFLDSQIDGMISLDGGLDECELQRFDDNGFSGRFVFACEWVHGSGLPSVRSDNGRGARLAVRHLHAMGHRKIAHLTGPENNVLTHARREGMIEERARLGLPARDEWIIRGDFSLQSGQMAAQKILAMDERPSAVFCASDQVAFGLMSTLSAGGLRVPEDISVIGFDDIELSEFYVPPLTTIRQNRRALGSKAAALLLERIDPETAMAQSRDASAGGSSVGRAPPEETPLDQSQAGHSPVVVDVELVNRSSVAAPSA
ncbi:LacI family transcriptional regulator [Rhodobacterales bacterium]|nr:LacI family transcriptional regulator [Rhodobacterales bacterium]